MGLIYCFNMERRVLLSSGMPPSHRVIVVDTFLDLLPDVCDEARTQMVGRGTKLPHPLRCSTSSIRNIQSMRALGGVLSGGTLPEEPVYATMAI